MCYWLDSWQKFAPSHASSLAYCQDRRRFRMTQPLLLDQIIQGDCVEVLNSLPEKSVDLIFADPPYNLQLQQDLWRPNLTRVEAVNESWDRFPDFSAYDHFSRAWLTACRRVLKDSGTIWVIGTYHNIYRLGSIMQDLGYWFLNDVVWIKANPMPQFRGVRFANAHETLIWASKFKGAKYTFNYHAMKELNGGKQMRSDWRLPICSGDERVKMDGKKAHPTQKPEALLYRIILASSHPGQIVLDPFLGSGTTAVVAKKLHRHWIGIELKARYVEIARARLEAIQLSPFSMAVFDVSKERYRPSQVEFARLLEHGLVLAGQKLFFQKDPNRMAYVRPNGKLLLSDGFEGSIHEAGRHLLGGAPCNGWQHWYFERDGQMFPIDTLREEFRRRYEV